MNDAPLDLRLVTRPGFARRSALEETTYALAYLIRQFEEYGKLDNINMRHAYSADAFGRVVLALDAATMTACGHVATPTIPANETVSLAECPQPRALTKEDQNQ